VIVSVNSLKTNLAENLWSCYYPYNAMPVTFVSIQGTIGPKGESGKIGVVGPMGNTGETGHTGAVGNMGVVGLPGENGATGATGITGPKGAIGVMGSTGPVGDTGATGPRGNSGKSAQQPKTGQLLFSYTDSEIFRHTVSFSVSTYLLVYCNSISADNVHGWSN